MRKEIRRRARSEEDKAERRERLLAAARGLFSSRGYEGTTIEAIAAEAGLSPGSFYRYFGGKLEAYRVLTAQGADILGGYLAEALSGDEEAPVALRALAEAYLRFFRERRDYYDIVAVLHLGRAEFFADLGMVPLLEDKAKSLLRRIEEVIESGMAEGLFREVDARKAAAAFWGMMDGLCLLEEKGSTGFVGAGVEELLDAMLDIIVAGLARG